MSYTYIKKGIISEFGEKISRKGLLPSVSMQYIQCSILPPTGTMSCVDLAPKGSAGGGKKIALYSGRRRPKSQT